VDVTTTPLTGLGIDSGVIGEDGCDNSENPTEFLAVTVKV
jgi:hypothetical protein